MHLFIVISVRDSYRRRITINSRRNLNGTWTLTGNELKMVVEGNQAIYNVSVTGNTMVITRVMADNHVSNSPVSKKETTYTKM